MDISTVASSVVSAVSARVVFHPIDTLRTISQTTNESFRMPMHRLWAGLLPSIALSVPGFTAYLVAYRQSKSLLAPELGATSLTNYIISGTMAELASSYIWTPTEVVKGRMQIDTNSDSTAKMLRSIYRAEGLRGFYHGYFMGLVVFVPHSIAWWVTYERSREWISNGNMAKLRPQDHALAAATATTTAVVLTNFLDVIKTRQQLAHAPEVAKLRPSDTKGLSMIVKNLVQESGWLRALTRGMGMRIMSTAPSSALAMAIMETLHPDPTLALVQED